MASIEISIKDDFGHVIEEKAHREYQLDLGNRTLAEIEEAVDKFKKRALSDIEADLLVVAQKNFIEQQKKEVC